MKKMLLALALSLCSAGALAEQAPVKVSTGPSSAYGNVNVYITAITDTVVVKKVRVNRGHCSEAEVISNGRLPIRLNYGSTMHRVLLRCNVMEVSIDTDQGDWTFNFNT